MKNAYFKSLLLFLVFALPLRFSYGQDAGVISLLSPQNRDCGTASAIVKVVVYNYGSTSISNIPVKLTVTGAGAYTFVDTLKKTLSSGGSDTLTFKKAINTINGGSFVLQPYTILAGDKDHTNDSLPQTTININALPVTPLGKGASRCGAGPLTYAAPSTTKGATTYWYPSSTSVAPIGYGDSISYNVFTTTTLYASSASGTGNDSIRTGPSGGSILTGGMFDVIPTNDVSVDSFDVLNYLALADSIAFYYRPGSYASYISTSSGWTHVGTKYFKPSAANRFTRVNFKKSISLSAHKTYGFYIVLYGLTKKSRMRMTYLSTPDTVKKSSIMVISGDATSSIFGGSAGTYKWNGDIFFSSPNCSSPLVAVKGTVKPLVNGIVLSRNKTSAGAFNSGLDSLTADQICVGDSMKYDIGAPTNFLNADYGTKWKIATTLKTVHGASSFNYVVTNPSAKANGVVSILPKAANADSLYILIVRATNISTGCDTAFTRYVHVNKRAMASFSVGNTCFGNAVTPINSSTITGSDSFLWEYGNGDTSHASAPTYKYGSAGTYTMTLTATNMACANSLSKSVTIYNAPYGSAILKGPVFRGQFNYGDDVDPDNICLGDTNIYILIPPKGLSNSDFGTKWVIKSMTFATVAGNGIKDTAFKKPTSGKNASLSFFPKSNSDSIYIWNIYLRTLPGNCDSIIRRVIHVRYKPVAKFGFTNACVGLPIVFKDSSTIKPYTLSQWTWDFGDPASGGTGGTSALQNPSHSFAKAGTYKVTLTAATDAGCSNTVSKTVQQYPRPLMKFVQKLQCNGGTSSFIDSSTIATGTISSRKWYFGDPASTGTSAAQTVSHAYIKSGFYSVKLVESSGFGCKDSISRSIRILPKPVPLFTYKPACTGSAIYFTNPTIDSSGIPAYLWNFGDKTFSNAEIPTHIYKTNGNYVITLKATAKNGCVDSTSQPITPYTKPNVNFFAKNGCAGQPLSLGDSGNAEPKSNYTWNFGDTKTAVETQKLTAHTYAKPGSYSVSLIVVNGLSCADSQRKTIVVSDVPKSAFTTNDICAGKTATFTNGNSGAGLTYLWIFGDKSVVATTKDAAHAYTKASTYTVKLATINSSGCADTSSKNLVVNPLPVVPKWTTKAHGYTVTFNPADTTLGSYTWYFGTSTNDSSRSKNPVYIYPSTDKKYGIRLKIVSPAGCVAQSIDSLDVKHSGISGEGNSLGGVTVYPNPFEGTTRINYVLGSHSMVNITIFDLQGRHVAIVKNGIYGPGNYNDVFDASQYHTPPGIYLLKMMVDDDYYMARIVNMR